VTVSEYTPDAEAELIATRFAIEIESADAPVLPVREAIVSPPDV
jgi:hypothetical protein